MARGKAHSIDTKAAAMAALLTGDSVGHVASVFNLPKQTVSNWKKEAWRLVKVGTKNWLWGSSEATKH